MRSAYGFVSECSLPTGKVQVTNLSEPCVPQWLLRSKCVGNDVNADPCRGLVAGCSAKCASGRSDILEYVTHQNDEYKDCLMPDSVVREECKSDCLMICSTTDYNSVNRFLCKSCCEPIYGTTDCNIIKVTRLTLSDHTPNDLPVAHREYIPI